MTNRVSERGTASEDGTHDGASIRAVISCQAGFQADGAHERRVEEPQEGEGARAHHSWRYASTPNNATHCTPGAHVSFHASQTGPASSPASPSELFLATGKATGPSNPRWTVPQRTSAAALFPYTEIAAPRCSGQGAEAHHFGRLGRALFAQAGSYRVGEVRLRRRSNLSLRAPDHASACSLTLGCAAQLGRLLGSEAEEDHLG